MQALTQQLTQELSNKMADTFRQIPQDVATGVLHGAHLALGLPLPSEAPRALARQIAQVAAQRIQALITEMSNELCEDAILIFADFTEAQHSAQQFLEPQLVKVLADLTASPRENPVKRETASRPATCHSTTGTATNGRVIRFLTSHKWREVSGANGHRVFRHESGHKVSVGNNPAKELKPGTQATLFKRIGAAMGGKVHLNGSNIEFQANSESAKPLTLWGQEVKIA